MTPVVADALEEAQAFVGSLVAHRLLHVSPLGQLFETERDHSFLVTERNNGAERLVMKGRHSIDFARRFAGGMRLATLRRTDRPDDRTEVRAEVVRLAKMLDKENGHRRHAGLVLGAKWLLDSYLGNDRILSYVQATVALETLLGDKAESDVVGIGALLANRCAYMLATSVVERRELLSSIKEIYRVRSKIVHEGQSRLAESQQYRLNQLRRICGRVIEHETKLIGP
ncbi:MULTISPECIES: HEPN domain-containing protein [Stenotrophomonas]|uniref:HEPN domain-containing protein n=1 Tax=Stenotrophomonas TaxID=40323 RepID=UPI0012E35A97|nr:MULTISPECIES: HEPN domain-containing protein [Stenotrophomonas]